VITNLLSHPDVGAIVVTGEDVSEPRRLSVTQHLESGLLERLPAAVVVTDDADIVVYWNRRAEQLLGYARAEAIGRSMDELTGGVATGPGADHTEDGPWEGDACPLDRSGELVPVVMTFDRVHVPGLDFDGTVRTMLDDRERKSLEGTLARHAMHDQLTGLPNRTLFIDRLDQALARRRRSASMLAVLSIDLDRFKAVNDAVGHSAGDEILASCAGLMEAVLGPDETMCRLGGDEFAVCSEGLTSPADAVEVADRLAAALAQPFVHDGTSHTVTISVGIAVARGLPGERPEPLLRDADAAMYKAKSKGRRRYELSDESLRDETNRRIELVAGLSRAVERGELRLRYQPVMDLVSGRMVGAEALLRWQHPQLGLLSPAAFIAIAEETDLIVPIGEWVLDTALEELARWHHATPHTRLTMSVNISTRQIASPTLLGCTADLLAKHAVDPAMLCLEITESTLLWDVDAAIAALSALRGLGVELAIDDFGTGYSSLGYLKHLPVDYLKIDRTFVRDMLTDPDDSVIVKAVIDLGSALGLQLVAEGVETLAQADGLAGLGCHLAQGYLWSEPCEPWKLLSLADAANRARPGA
jgi:diguanylate cyclase (GGDEF)-like protein